MAQHHELHDKETHAENHAFDHSIYTQSLIVDQRNYHIAGQPHYCLFVTQQRDGSASGFSPYARPEWRYPPYASAVLLTSTTPKAINISNTTLRKVSASIRWRTMPPILVPT